MKNNSINIQKRYKIISIFSVVLFALLTMRLATLTIAKGDHFRQISENMRIKDIYVTAPRGEIRDRNGILLAGNKPMFTLQILKDEFGGVKVDEKNEYLLNVITLLEQDAINYTTEFPLLINEYIYDENASVNSNDISPRDRILDIIIENDLIDEILDSYYLNTIDNKEFKYFAAQNIINSLEFNSKEVPIKYELQNDNLIFSFIEGFQIENWYKENNIPIDSDPKTSLKMMVDNDKTILKKLLSHPINREIVYDLIKNRNLEENILLIESEISFYRNYINLKNRLIDIYPEITVDTTAEEDFKVIFEKNSLRNFLKYEVNDEGINVSEIITKIFEENNIDIDYKLEIKDGIPIYTSIDNTEMEEPFLIDIIANRLITNELVDDLINYKGVVSHIQKQMINDGINSGISVTDGFEYSSLKSLKDFMKKYSIPEDATNSEILNVIKEYYSLKPELTKNELYGIFNVYHQLEKPGQLTYIPINFSYGLKNETVAKIEEQIADFDGFSVSLEPVRYYPNGESASHILGYMGKISQSNEIEEYINKNNYNPDVLIGKTGIEESFQKNLYGKNGYKRVEVDSLGNTSKVIDETKPQPGDNIYLSIDYKLQKRAEDSLDSVLRTIRTGGTNRSPWGDYEVVRSTDKGRPYKNATSGAVMAVDVNTGEVLAMASYPSFDPNLFATGISTADWEGLIPETQADPLAPRPLYNVATQTAIQPGSTFKMVTALAGLEKGLDPKLKINDRGYITIGDTEFGCWIWNQHQGMHGPMNLVEAIRDSCNYYFYSLALGENQRTGESVGVRLDITDISNMAEKLGLGSKTGLEINIPHEAAPGVPNPEVQLNIQKGALRRWLNSNIHKFYVGSSKFEDELKQNTIDAIVSWIDLDEIPSLDKVYKDLAKLDLDGTKPVIEGRRDTLADYIKFSNLNSAKWTLADTINITIGQGLNSYTLSQMTNYVATISNGGYKNKLTLISNIKNSDNSKIEFENEPTKERIELNNYNNLDYLKEGMLQAANTGLNKNVFGEFPIKVGLKTGTAERSGINPVTRDTYDSFSYEVAFAPYDNPRIAVAVVIFQGGAGSNCSPIVRDVIAEYMGLYKVEEADTLPIEMDIIP